MCGAARAGIPIRWSTTGFGPLTSTGSAIPPEITHYAALVSDLTVKCKASAKRLFRDDVRECPSAHSFQCAQVLSFRNCMSAHGCVCLFACVCLDPPDCCACSTCEGAISAPCVFFPCLRARLCLYVSSQEPEAQELLYYRLRTKDQEIIVASSMSLLSVCRSLTLARVPHCLSHTYTCVYRRGVDAGGVAREGGRGGGGGCGSGGYACGSQEVMEFDSRIPVYE